MNERNVGDVTGPRWAGGTRNPDGAEKAYESYPAKEISSPRAAFMAGRTSRDAEVEELRRRAALEQAYSDADTATAAKASSEVGVLREQLAVAEARAVHAELEWAEADARTVLAEAAKADAWDEGWRAGGKHQHESTLYRQSLTIGPELEPPAQIDNPYRTGDTNA